MDSDTEASDRTSGMGSARVRAIGRAQMVETKRRWLASAGIGRAVIIFVLAAQILGFRYYAPSIASAIPDPVTRYRAQDEAVYAHIALRMAHEGGWLTPRYMGRFLLYKPPLLTWLAGLSVRLFGVSLAALRLPALAAGAAGVLLLAFWPVRAWGRVFAALLLAGNSYWHTFSRICQTDILSGASLTAAMFLIARDPPLARTSSFVGFAIAAAAGLMSKSVAGLLAPLILILYVVIARKESAVPGPKRVIKLLLLICCLAAPWHIYQLVFHTRWFWADYVQYQLFAYGFSPPGQVTAESAATFYLKRLWLGDPVLCIAAALALPFCVRAAAQGRPGARLIAAWLVVTGGSLLAFQYHSVHYVVTLIPGLCALAVSFGPLAKPRFAAIGAGLLCAAFALKATGAGPWALSYGREATVPSVTAIRTYYEQGRNNGLIIVQPDDDFYSSTLTGLNVRYCFLDRNGLGTYPPHFVRLGVAMSAAEFTRWRQALPIYRERLRLWGIDSPESVASVVVATGPADVAGIIRAWSDWDFLVPSTLRNVAAEASRAHHTVVPATEDRVLLLSHTVRSASKRSLPHQW